MKREPDWMRVYAAAERAATAAAFVPAWIVWRAVNAAFAEYESQLELRCPEVTPWDQLELQVQTEVSDEAHTAHD